LGVKLFLMSSNSRQSRGRSILVGRLLPSLVP
jgi:hypothetical protein